MKKSPASQSQRKRISPFSLKGLLFIAISSVLLMVTFEVLVRLFANQGVTTEIISGPEFQYTDEGIQRYRPNAAWRRIDPEYTIDIRINEFGLRDENNYHNRLNSRARTRFLILGDSFAFGAANQYEDIFHVILESKLNEQLYDVEFIKAGVSSYDQYLEYHYMEEISEVFKPEYIVVCFLPNDLFTNERLDWEYDIDQRKNLSKGGPYLTFQTVKFLRSVIMNNDAAYVKLYGRTGRDNIFHREKYWTSQVKAQYEVTSELFNAFHEYCRERGLKLIVISIPQLFQLLKEPDDRVDPEMPDLYFGERAKKAGYKWIRVLSDLKDAAATHGKPTHFRVDGHLTPFGNQIVASKLFSEFKLLLSQKELASPKSTRE